MKDSPQQKHDSAEKYGSSPSGPGHTKETLGYGVLGRVWNGISRIQPPWVSEEVAKWYDDLWDTRNQDEMCYPFTQETKQMYLIHPMQ